MTSATSARTAGTSAGPTARSVARSGRGPVAVIAVLLLVAVGLALVTGTRRAGALDPRAYDPGGAHAVAALLKGRGVPVHVVTSLDGARAEAGPRTTLVVPFPASLTTLELVEVRGVAGRQLIVGASYQDSTDALGFDVTVGSSSRPHRMTPHCSLPIAQTAGSARLGGYSYSGAAGTSCYDASLYTVGMMTLVGSGDFLTNGRLDQDGNAALALGLLGPSTKVLWLLPRTDRAVLGEKRTLRELLPEWVLESVLQLCIAVVLLALWRARRLGRVVVEPLPVVVRAAEAVEGRGRLYRSVRARDRAAEALRAATRDAVARRLGLGLTGTPAALVAAASARTGRPPAEVEALLYGPVPLDDDSLVLLADALSRFDSEVSVS